MPTRLHWCEWRRGRQKELFEDVFPWPSAGTMGLEVVCRETDAPHWVQRAGFSQTFSASAQKVLINGWVL